MAEGGNKAEERYIDQQDHVERRYLMAQRIELSDDQKFVLVYTDLIRGNRV
ncbi:hypothetical protein [Sphingomonas sp.]|uniref:hypothetical protein n=1 Tax=Sphingomonas sp. TaxID=28214 RepID=UPI0035C7C66B